MARINLLPWRDELRREKNQEFGVVAVLTALAAAVFVGLIIFYMNNSLANQRDRNQFLQNEINILDDKIEKIRELESTKANLLARMNIIQQLQRSRPEAVHLFEDLVTTVPDGVWLTSVTQTGSSLAIKGKAESNGRVSAYMRQLEASDYLGLPRLEVIEADKDSRNNNFTLTVPQEGLASQAEETTATN